jgi:hypothetical protein
MEGLMKMVDRLKLKPITSYLDQETWDKIRTYSIENDISIAKLIIRLIKNHIEKIEKKKTK